VLLPPRGVRFDKQFEFGVSPKHLFGDVNQFLLALTALPDRTRAPGSGLASYEKTTRTE
jgi:hypothetical protein